VTVFAIDDLLVRDLLLASKGGLFERDGELDAYVALVALAHAKNTEQVAENAIDGDVADVDHPAREGSVRTERR
jgi:hypothetical protein